MLIETERLRLRPWLDADADSFAVLQADPVVMDDLGGPLDRRASDRKLDRYIAAYESHGYGRWLIETLQGEFIGCCGVMPVRDEHPLRPHDEIGWRLRHRAWGKGYATEAARAALRDAFCRPKLREVLAYTAPDNFRSRAIMERLQLEREPARDFALHGDRGSWQGLVWSARPDWLARDEGADPARCGGA